MKFQRTSELNRPRPKQGEQYGDLKLDDDGYLWVRTVRKWRLEKNLLVSGEHRLIDVAVEPAYSQGDNGDMAVDIAGHCWHKAEGRWEYGGCLVDYPVLRSMEVDNLSVRANFSVPIVSGKIPVYDGLGKLYGHIAVERLVDEGESD